ncbi:MAG: hypothetical protein D6798_09745, partial [Deltaproteobacteria bacterium]
RPARVPPVAAGSPAEATAAASAAGDRRWLLWASAALLVLTVLWAADAAVGSGVFWAHDLRHHHMPWRVWAASEWAAGRVPLWNPAVGNGFPMMADGQAGVFYPPTMLLFILLPPALALNQAVLLHTFWAGLGAFQLSRSLKLRPEAALAGGVAFAFSGVMASHTVYLGMQNALAWLPWALWAIVAGRWAWLGIAGFMMATAGHPQAAAFGLMLCGATALWRRQILPFALAMGLGLLAASPQLVATLELSHQGLRDGGVDALFANIGAMPPQELLGAALPDLFGHDAPSLVPETYYHRGPGYWGQGLNHWEMCFFLGVPAIVVAVAGAMRRRWWFWWLVVGGSAVLMLGNATPAWPLLRKLPGLSGFRFPVRFSLLLTMAFSVLTAAGVHAVVALPADRLRRLRRVLVGLAVVLAVAFGAARLGLALAETPLRQALTAHFLRDLDTPPPPPEIADHPLRDVLFPGPEPEDPDEIPAKVDRIVADLARSTAPWSPRVLWPVGMVCGVALLLGLRDRWGAGRTALALAGLLYLDLWRFGAGYNGRYPRSFVESRPELLEYVDLDRPDRLTVVDRRIDPELDVQVITSSLGLLYGTRDVILTTPLLILRTEVLLWRVGLDVGDKGIVKWDRLLARPELVDLLGVRWLTSVHRVDDERLDAAGLRWVADTADGRVHLYENVETKPPAWLVSCALPTTTDAIDADPVAALARLDPDRPLVELPEGVTLPVGACQPGGDTSAGEARLVEETGTSLRFVVDADSDALMVQRDTFYPGWVARVDGQEVPLVRTAFAFRGLPVPAGHHEVELAYEPARLGIVLGVAPVALLTLVAWGGLSAMGRRRRRRPVGRQPAGS